MPFGLTAVLLAAMLLGGALPEPRGMVAQLAGTGPATAVEACAQARRLIDLGQLAAAEQLLRAALRTDAESADLHALLGDVLFRTHHATESLAEYTAAARGRTPTSREFTVIASDYVLLKDYADAARWLRAATEADPGNAAAWYLLGRAEYNGDKMASAAAAFERSLALVPRDVRAEYNLGLAYEKLDRPEEARAAYRTAIEWGSGHAVEDAQPYLNLGVLELTEHHPREAVPLLETATRISPRNAFAFEQMGLALDAAGRPTEAAAALERAAALAPGANTPHFFLGRIYRRLGRNDAAAAQFRMVEQILGSHSDTSTPNLTRSPDPGGRARPGRSGRESGQPPLRCLLAKKIVDISSVGTVPFPISWNRFHACA